MRAAPGPLPALANPSRADWMLRQLAAAVYRTLEVLERRGLLTRMHLDSYHGYTVCDDGHHHHLLCRSCGRVATVDARGVEAEIHKLAEQLDFRVDTHTLEFSGLCRTCQVETMPLAGSPAA